MINANPISIAICTYNRAQSLEETLQQLVNVGEFLSQDELIIVDNNSSDNTAEVVKDYRDSLPIHYVFEAKQGLSAARNRALREFKHDLLVFIDDDITIDKGLIHTWRQAVNLQHHFFGGRIHVDWQGGKPYWLKSDNLPLLNGLLVKYDLGDLGLEYDNNTLLPYGANFALRRALIEEVGQFNPNLGVNGTQIGRGEETEYFMRAMKAGYTGWYLPDAKAYHRLDTQRFGLAYLFRYGQQKGIAELRLKTSTRNGSVGAMLLFGVKGIYQLLKCRKDRFYQCVINAGIEYALYRRS